MHRLQSASPFFSSNENIKYEEAIISLEQTISFVTSVNLKNAVMVSRSIVMKRAIHVAMISFAVVFGIDFSFCESFFVR